MGSLAACLLHKIPRDLLVPILPPSVSFDGKSYGKAPALFKDGGWKGFEDWQLGGHDPQIILKPADEAGGNAGVILGAPSGDLQMIAIDIDLDDGPKAVAWRNEIVLAIQRQWSQPLWVRETWPYRALLLANLPVDASPGAKKVFTLSHAEGGAAPEKIGKIEILATGQQCVIAGTHHSGRVMTWYREDGSGSTGGPRFPAPPVTEGLPVFPTFDALAASIVDLLTSLGGYGFSYTTVGVNATGGTPDSLSDLAAPSVDDLVGLLDVMPNPPEVDRDVYLAVMFAVGGARAGLLDMRGALSHDDEVRIAHAVANWAARWQAPKGQTAGTFEEELAKWQEDLGRPRDERYAGWRRLLIHAQSFGAPVTVLENITADAAQSQFKADTTSTPPPSMAVPNTPVMTGAQMVLRQGVNPDHASTADIPIAERLLQEFSANAIWVPGLGTWLIWDGHAGWRSDDVTACKIEVLVYDKLWWYCAVYGRGNPAGGVAPWGQVTLDKILSHGRATRVTSVLKSFLAKSVSQINCGILKLQTPRNMYDLVTMEVIPEKDILRRKMLNETRSAGVEPEMNGKGSTKWFDKLTLDLCDGNHEVHEWLLHYFGYCLLGEPNDDVFVVIWGSGGNGKSTLVKVLQTIFGTYAVSINPEVIEDTGKNLHPASLNRLRDKRLAMVSEIKKDAKWNERVLKMITGGDDIEARDMHKNPTPFRSQAGVIILSNEKPSFSNVEPAIQRRFRMISTVVKRPEAEIIKDLEDRILSEAGAVLHKIMGYAKKVRADGQLPKPPPAMKAFANEIMASGDVVYAFLQEECMYGTADVADEEEDIEMLRTRCEAYMKRHPADEGSFTADRIPAAAFIERLRREGISLEDPTKTDSQGRPTRHQKMVKDKKVGIERKVFIAKGIRLRVREAAAA